MIRKSVVAVMAGITLIGCSLESGLSADSTCAEFNAASVDEQRAAIQQLVVDAEDGRSNPLREANAVMQITYTCQASGSEETLLGDITI